MLIISAKSHHLSPHGRHERLQIDVYQELSWPADWTTRVPQARGKMMEHVHPILQDPPKIFMKIAKTVNLVNNKQNM